MKYEELLPSHENSETTTNNLIHSQGSRSSRVVCALSTAKLQDGYVPYNWEKKMQEFLPVSNSSCFLSMLILPKALDPLASRYNSLQDTLARANAWLCSSQTSGVPIEFMNVQTEALLTKVILSTPSMDCWNELHQLMDMLGSLALFSHRYLGRPPLQP